MITFTNSDCPRASIIVVAHARADRLEECLASLAAHTIQSSVPSETLLVLNGATAEVRALIETGVHGARVLHSPVNVGFAGACNMARRQATGDYVVLLNDDAEVEHDWLDALIKVADKHPTAGAVGSCILFPDGRLQEAGSIIWGDGTTKHVGRGASDLLQFDYIRAVDYCSACSLLVRATTWDALGGMDEGYFPAYSEDVDLCLRIRALGQQVLFAPRSRVRHHEGSSTASDFRAFIQSQNRERLLRRWSMLLAGFDTQWRERPAGAERAILRARGYPRRLLIIDDRVPCQAIGSGFGRMLDIMRELSATYAITLFTSDESPLPSAELSDMGVRRVTGTLAEHVASPEHLYDAVLISRPHNFERYAHVVAHHQPQAAIVYDAEAVYHRRLEVVSTARADAAGDHEAQRMRALESSIRGQVDAVVAVSDSEAGFFSSCAGDGRVYSMQPSLSWAQLTTRRFDARDGVVFVAGWLAGADSPNADALAWFTAAVWPSVVQQVHNATLSVTGDVPESVRDAHSCSSIRFIGRVHDLYELYDSARVAIAPMRIGAGVSLKVLEALGHGVPIVTTSLGAGALLPDDAQALSIADDAETFARALVSLLVSEQDWTTRRQAIEVNRQEWRPHQSGWSEVLDAAQLERDPLKVKARRRAAARAPSSTTSC